MGIFKNLTSKLSHSAYERRAHKAANSKHVSAHQSYLLGKDTPFDVTEAFRNLKASLSVSVPKQDGGVAIVITSPYPEDGKTTVTTNLALMFALSDAKVLLVDADIRKGRVAKYFNAKSKNGLADYLSGQITLEEAIRPSEINENLSYIACGTHSPKPYELLESAAMGNLIEELRKQYDYIIIDTPPVLLLSDALALSPITDGTVLVCRHQVSFVSDIERALNSLHFSKANVLGLVVNDYKAPKVHKFYGGSYNHYYYNYKYGSTNPEDTDAPTDVE